MKIFFCSFFLGALVLQCAGQNEDKTDLARLKALNAQFIINFVTNDSVAHNKILHPGFICITSNGQYVSRQEYLDGWAHGFDGFKYWDYRDERITLFGNTALVHAQNKYVMEKDGKLISGMFMYTDIYIKEKGEWKCVQAQITRVSPENYSSDETIVKKYEVLAVGVKE